MRKLLFANAITLLLFLVAATYSFAQCPGGQTQITITVKTDNYPGETTWVLKDYLSGAELLSGGPYANANTVYTHNVCVATNGILQFEIYDAVGDGLCCAYGSGFYNITKGATTLISGGSFTNQEVKIFAVTPQTRDLMITQITTPSPLLAGNQQIQGKALNLGTTTITNFTLKYRVNGGATYTQTGISASIAPGTEYNFTHSTLWLANFGNNLVEVWTENPNGLPDLNTTNDLKTKTITVTYEVAERTVLIEHFTNASCNPCAVYNPGMMSVLNNPVNAGKYAHIAYHTSFPGYDPMYSFNTADPTARLGYYGVGGVPRVVVEGVQSGSPTIVTTNLINQYKSITPTCNLTIQETKSGNFITITATVTPLTDFVSGSNRLHIALVEQMVNYPTPPGTNGEANFPNVLRKMLPSAAGVMLPPLSAGQTHSITQTYTISGDVNANQLRTVVFVQDNSSKTVLQTFRAPNASGNNTLAESASITPMNATISSSCFGNSNGAISLSMSNGVGALVNYQWSTGQSGASISGLAAGAYTVSVYSATSGNFLKAHTFQVNQSNPFTITPVITNPVCTAVNNGSIQLQVSGLPMNTYTYQWSSGQTTSTINNLAVGAYTVTITGNLQPNCQFVQSFTLTAPAPPTVSVPTSGFTYCAGNSALPVTFTGNTSGATYSWTNNNTSIGLPASGSGNIGTFLATNNSGAPITASITVIPVYAGCSGLPQNFTITVNPIPSVVLPPNQNICAGANNPVILLNSNVSGASFTWTNNNPSIGLPASGSGNIPAFMPINTLNNPVSATVSITPTANGCTGAAQSFNINVHALPNPQPIATPSVVCPGQTAILIASNGLNYTWSNGMSGNPISVNPATTTTYSVTATNSLGCANSASVTVSVASSPAVNVTSNNPCLGSVFQLFATGGTAYLWTGPNGFFSSVQNPVVSNNASSAMSGVYTVQVTDANDCITTNSVTVLVSTGLTPTITGNTVFCANSSTTLGLSATYSTYLWSTGATAPTITATNAGTYSVTVSNAIGCSGVATVTLSTNPAPMPSIGSNSPICAGANLNLNASTSGGVSYNWSGPAGFVSVQQNPVRTSAVPAMSGTYTVTVTNAQGCTASASTVATVNALPNATASSNTPCVGGAFTLQANGGSNYTWSGPNGFMSYEQNLTVTANANVSFNGIYTVTVTNSNNCSAEAATSVIVTSTLNPNISGNTQLCSGETSNLSVGNSYATYSWSTGSNLPSITVSNTGTYAVTVTSASGCVGSAVVSVAVNPAPVANASSNSPICAGNLLTLSSSGGSSYGWSGPNGYTSTLQNPSINNAQTSMSGVYTVTVSNTFGCSDTKTVTVSVIAPANAGNNNSAEVCNAANEGTTTVNLNTLVTGMSGGIFSPIGGAPPLTAGSTFNGDGLTPNTTYQYQYTVIGTSPCPNSTATMSITVNDCLICAAIPIATFGYGNSAYCRYSGGAASPVLVAGATSGLWSVSPSGLSINPANGIIDIGNSAPGTYTITNFVAASGACPQANASAVVTIHALPTANAGLDQSICLGQNATLSASGGISYQWSNGLLGAAITVSPTENTTYTVTVTNTFGCTASDAVVVSISAPPPADAGLPQSICPGQAATLSASGGVNYVWNTGQTGATITVNPDVSGFYSVTVTGANTCTASDQVWVAVYANPTASAGPDQTICAGGNTSLIATGGNAYLWSNGQTGSIIQVNPVTNSTYSVTVTDNNGCTAADEVTIWVNNLPLANAGPNQTICYGQSATLSASGGIFYQWNNELGNTPSIVVNPNTTTTYTVTVTDADGCTDTDAATVVVEQMTYNIINLATGANEPLFICTGDGGYIVSFVLGGGAPPYWVNGSPIMGNVYTSPVLYGSSYTILISDNNQCLYQLTGSAPPCSPNPACMVNVGITPVYDSGGCIDGFKAVPTGGVPASSMWYSVDGINFQSSSTFSNLNNGTYPVYAYRNGCGAWLAGNFTMPNNSLEVFAYAVTQANGNYTGIAEVSGGTPFYTYLWSNGSAGGAANLGSFTQPYTVTVTDKNGCKQWFTLEPNWPVGIENTQLPKPTAKLYPNPSQNGWFTIDLPDFISTIQPITLTVFDITGKRLQQYAYTFLPDEPLLLNLSAYNTGIYFVHLQIENQVLVLRASVLR